MRILCYTRQPEEDILYANRLAYSMHLAWESGTGAYIPFHHNEGILYAKATQDMQTGVLCAKSLKNPWIFQTEDGSYGIAAVRTDAEGERDAESEGCILVSGVRIWCIMRKPDSGVSSRMAMSARSGVPAVQGAGHT